MFLNARQAIDSSCGRVYRICASLILFYCIIGGFVINNSSVASIPTAIAAILLFSACVNQFSIFNKEIDLLLCVFFTLLAIAMMSRIVWIGVFLSFYYILFTRFRFISKRVFLGSIVLLAILSIVLLSLTVKTASTYGRWHILKMTILMVKEYWLWGMPQSYSTCFNHTQAAYFTHNYLLNSQGAFLAANGYFPLNEYMSFVLLIGVPACVLLALIATVLYFRWLRRRWNITSFKPVLFFIAFVSAFSYPLQYPVIILIIASILIYSFTSEKLVAFVTCTVAALLLTVLYQLSHFYFRKELTSVKHAYDIGYINKADTLLENCYRYRRADYEYYIMVAKICQQRNQLSHAVAALEKAHVYGCDNKMHLFWGDCYKEMGMISKAISHKEQAIGIYPALFESRDNLLQLYVHLHDTSSVLTTAKNIIDLPEKIPSARSGAYKKRALAVYKAHLR